MPAVTTTVGFPRARSTGRYTRIRVKRKRKAKGYARFRKRRFVNPQRRLSGTTGMPYFKYSRCYDGPPLHLSVTNETAAGFWTASLHTDFNNIPAAATFKDIYRFFRIKKVLTQYTPATRSDEYSKLFAWPTSGTQQLYNANGGCLEIKHLKYLGYDSTPSAWSEVLNRAGKLRKCAGTAPFRTSVTPVIHQMIGDTVTADPTRVIKAPWLSTDVSNNLSLDHFYGIDCWHTLNNVSYDNSNPLVISQRVVIEMEFKGLKI